MFFFFKAALASSSYPHFFISNGRRKHAGFGENYDLFKPYSRISIKLFAELDIRGELILSDPAFKVQRRHQFFGIGKASELYVVDRLLCERDQNKWCFHNQHLPNDLFGEREEV